MSRPLVDGKQQWETGMSFEITTREDCEQLVRQGYEALNRGAVDEVVRMIHSEFQYDAPAGVLHDERGESGPRRFERYLRHLTADWAEFRCELQELRHAGELLVALVREEGRERRSGDWVAQESFHIWTIRDGKAVRFGRHTRVSSAA